MEKDKTSLYLLSIVGIVAVVGIVVLVLNAGYNSTVITTEDLAGQVEKIGVFESTNDPNSDIDDKIAECTEEYKSCKSRCAQAKEAASNEIDVYYDRSQKLSGDMSDAGKYFKANVKLKVDAMSSGYEACLRACEDQYRNCLGTAMQ